MRIALGSFATLASAAADWDPIEISQGYKNGCKAITDQLHCNSVLGIAWPCAWNGNSCDLATGAVSAQATYDALRADGDLTATNDLYKATLNNPANAAGGGWEAACMMWDSQADLKEREAGCKGQRGGSYNKCNGTTECYGANTPEGCVACISVPAGGLMATSCNADKMGKWTFDMRANPAACAYANGACTFAKFGNIVTNWCADNASSATRTATAFSVLAAAAAALAM